MRAGSRPISLFYSYAHEDEGLRQKLETQLRVLRRGGRIAEWHDRNIKAGDDWKTGSDRHLASADIILPLVSDDFIASDYCWGEEMTQALERHARGEARVIPVILRHCRWPSTPLARLQAVPTDARPVASWPDEDAAFDDVTSAIGRAADGLRRRATTAIAAEAGEESRPDHDRRADLAVLRDEDAQWCPEMVVIPSGWFLMGSPPDEAERSEEEGPQHRVTIPSRFAIGRYAVTFAEYDHFCEVTGREKPGDNGWGRGRQPVINVSWRDARAYVEWLSGNTKQSYRLVSEAEWEYACRAGTTTPFWFGRMITTDQVNYDGNYTYEGSPKGKHRKRTVPVGSLLGNPWTLHEMHGNVWEWLEDVWHDSYAGAPMDGSAWTDEAGINSGSARVVRGGSWATSTGGCRSACRYGLEPDFRNINLGFRVARTLA